MSYFGALPTPTAAQRREGDALSPFSVDEFGNGQRMILLPRSDGEAPFWAKASDVIAAHKKNPSAQVYMIPRIMSGPETKNGMTVVSSSFGVKREDVVAVVEKFAPPKGPVFTSRGSGLPSGPDPASSGASPTPPSTPPTSASSDTPATSKLPLALGVAGAVLLAAIVVLRRR